MIYNNKIPIIDIIRLNSLKKLRISRLNAGMSVSSTAFHYAVDNYNFSPGKSEALVTLIDTGFQLKMIFVFHVHQNIKI